MASNLPQPPTGNDSFLNRWLYLLWDKVRRSLSPEEIPDLDWSKITTGKPTTLSGYGITDGYSHPATHPATMIDQDSTHRFVSDSDISDWDGKAPGTHYHAFSVGNGTSQVIAFNVGDMLNVVAGTNVSISYDDATNTITINTSGELAGNAETATRLQTARTINGVAFDGSADITIYDSTKASASHAHDFSSITSKPTTLAGYGITDAAALSHTHSGYASSGAITGSGLTMGTGKLIGRNTAGTGAPEEITLGANLSMSGTTLNAAGGGGYTWISQAVSGTATSISIPAGVKEMVILFDNITTSSADSVSKAVRIRLGTSGGIDSGSTYRNGNYTYMDFFYGLMLNAYATSCQALMFLYRVGGTGNYWFGSLDASNALGSLSKTLSAELTTIQVSYMDAGYTFTGGYIRVGYR